MIHSPTESGDIVKLKVLNCKLNDSHHFTIILKSLLFVTMSFKGLNVEIARAKAVFINKSFKFILCSLLIK